MAKTRSRAARAKKTAAPAGAVRVALVQAKATEDAEANLSRTLARVAEAATKGARLVCRVAALLHQEPR